MKYIFLSLVFMSSLSFAKPLPTDAIEAINILSDAQSSNKDVATFLRRANLHSLDLKREVVGGESRIVLSAEGTVIVQGDIACGEMKLQLVATYKHQEEMHWRVYTSKLTDNLSSWCAE